MNREECTGFYARDELVLTPIVNATCDANLIVWSIWLGILTLMKILTAIGLSVAWYKNRRRKRVNDPSRRNRRRFPLAPVLISILSLVFVTFLVTTAMGVCNSSNGCGIALYTTMWALFAVYSLVLQNHFISLGKRMIPLATTKIKIGIVSNSSSEADHNRQNFAGGDMLAKMDNVLRSLFAAQFITLSLAWAFATPIQLLSPREQYGKWASLSYIMQGLCFFAGMLTFLMQLQRLVVATKLGCTKPYHIDVSRALVKMRKIQVSFTVIYLSAIALTFAGAVQLTVSTWYFTLMLMTLETIAASVSFAYFTWDRLRANRKRKLVSFKGADNGDIVREGTGEDRTSTHTRNQVVAVSAYQSD